MSVEIFDYNRSCEPLVISAGDTVKFTRCLSRYQPTNGWGIEYISIGGGAEFIWTATANTDGTGFLVNIPATTTLQYVPGEYVIQGFAFSVNTGERFQFYEESIKVQPNFQAAQSDLDTSTHAQRMLASLEDTLEQMAKHDINDSTNEANEFHRKRLAEVTETRDKYLRERENELQRLAARAGKPSRKKIKQVLLVTNPYGGLNQFGVGNNIGNFG